MGKRARNKNANVISLDDNSNFFETMDGHRSQTR